MTSGLVLVTGGGGMIGSVVVSRLHAAGTPVRCHAGPPGAPSVAPAGGVEVIAADIDDAVAVRRLCDGVESVVHLAGPPSVADSFADPIGTVRAHVLGTAVLVHASRQAGVRRLVYISSAEVYGRAPLDRVPETQETSPRSPYAAAKLGAEALVRSIPFDDDLGVVVLRPFSVYGAGVRVTSLVGTVIRQALSSPEIRVHSLRTVRDYVHVDDVAAAIERSLDAPPGGIYNIGTGVASSVADVAAAALGAAGRSVPVRETGGADRPGGADLDRLVADPSAAAAGLGWRSAISLQDGIAGLVAHLLHQHPPPG